MNNSQYNDFAGIYEKADMAGRIAAKNCTPTPMVVGQAKNIFSNEMDYSKGVEVVEAGVCGFAWVNIKPGTSAFAKFLMNNGYARKDEFYGGVTVWVRDYNQSMTLKEAYAEAFSQVLTAAGFKSYSMSRMD